MKREWRRMKHFQFVFFNSDAETFLSFTVSQVYSVYNWISEKTNSIWERQYFWLFACSRKKWRNKAAFCYCLGCIIDRVFLAAATCGSFLRRKHGCNIDGRMPRGHSSVKCSFSASSMDFNLGIELILEKKEDELLGLNFKRWGMESATFWSFQSFFFSRLWSRGIDDWKSSTETPASALSFLLQLSAPILMTSSPDDSPSR